MSVVNTKSAFITNADAVPPVQNNSFVNGGHVISAVGTVEVAAADNDGSVYRMFRVPSGALMRSLTVFCDAITAGTSYTAGLYKTAANGGAVVSGALFATAFDMSSAITAGTQILHQANDIANCEKRIWELLGLASDPGIDYDVCLVGTTVGSAAGTLTLKGEWLI